MTITDQPRPANPSPDPGAHPGTSPATQRRRWYQRRRVLAAAAAALLMAVMALVGWRVQVAKAQDAVRVAAAAAATAESARVAAAAEAERLDVLAEAVTACFSDAPDGVELADGNRSLLIDTAGKGQVIDALVAGTPTTRATIKNLSCILGETRAPQAVIAEMNATRALDGRRTGTWDDITASWSYHPDDGMDVILTVE